MTVTTNRAALHDAAVASGLLAEGYLADTHNARLYRWAKEHKGAYIEYAPSGAPHAGHAIAVWNRKGGMCMGEYHWMH